MNTKASTAGNDALGPIESLKHSIAGTGFPPLRDRIRAMILDSARLYLSHARCESASARS